MLTQEEINNWNVGYEHYREQCKTLEGNVKNLRNVLHCLQAAAHWLHETGEYESQMLDEIHERIDVSINELKNFLDAAKE